MRHRGAVTTATSRGPPNLNAPGSCERALKKSSRGWRRGLIVFVAFSRLRFAKPQLRDKLLKSVAWNIAATLGEEAWQTFGNRGPKAVLISVSRNRPARDHAFTGLDA